jgi:hypothetical protein
MLPSIGLLLTLQTSHISYSLTKRIFNFLKQINYLPYRLWHIATHYSSPTIIPLWQSTLSEQTCESEPETDNTVDIGIETRILNPKPSSFDNSTYKTQHSLEPKTHNTLSFFNNSTQQNPAPSIIQPAKPASSLEP